MAYATREAPRNAQEQAQQTGTDIVKRLKQHNFAIAKETKAGLVAQGFQEGEIVMLSGTCLAIGVSPNLAAYSHNIPVIVRVMSLIKEYGYKVGEDFYVAVFKNKQKIVDEDGAETDQKADAPTIVVMPSAGRAVANMEEHDRLYGMHHHMESSVIADREEAKRIFFEQGINKTNPWKDEVVVACTELYTYGGNWQPIGSGKPQKFYGFYLPWTQSTFNNVTTEKQDFLEQGKAKTNYSVADVAIKRSMTKAARAVTRENYAKDRRTVDERMAALMETASTNLMVAAQRAEQFDVDVETALTQGENLKKEDKRYTSPMAAKEIGDYTTKLLEADEPVTAMIDEDYAKELQGFASSIVDVDEADVSEEAPRTLVEALQVTLDNLLPLAKGYRDLIRLGELDAAGNRAARVGGDEEADEDRKTSLRIIVNKICGWTGDEDVFGVSKSEILLAVMGGKWDDGLSMTTGACTQMRKDLPTDLSEIGMGKKPNPYHSKERCGIIESVGESIDQLPKEPA